MFAVSLFGSTWQVANASIVSTYKAFSKEKIRADVGVYVGLRHVNITLQGKNNSIKHNFSTIILNTVI